jgi:lipopolysaccharide/colanic/teichoic acid biosynthesis glycosyltransferase
VSIHGILLDSRHSFAAGERDSLLLAPVGTGTLLEHMEARLDALSPHPPVVAAIFDADERYRKAVRSASARTTTVVGRGELSDWLNTCEPSDWLLFLDPRCYPVEPLDPKTISRHSSDPRWVRNLVALDQNPAGTRERVDLDYQGRVRRIQRHYELVTWPFTAGVASSLVPAASLMIAADTPFSSLAELRQLLASRGVPSRDFALRGEVLDLTREAHLLLLSERLAQQAVSAQTDATGEPRPLLSGQGQQIHPTARFVGPVVLHSEVVVEEDAKIVGPAVIGPRVKVGASAVIAQSLIAADVVIPPGAVVRHRVLVENPTAKADAVAEDPTTVLYLNPSSGPPTPPMERTPRPGGPPAYRWIRPLAESVAAVVALVLLSPLLLLVAIVIKLDSRGSVLYGHRREGRNGKAFSCWKFRTMCDGADARQRELGELNQVDGPQFKIAADPRITRVGAFLRAWNIDEIPQLLNVVTGQMGFVGPRPSPFRENQYCVPWREGRLSVRPGITGLWQVSRHNREGGDFHQWIQYDLLYVRYRSPLVDLKIILATLVVTLRLRQNVPAEWILPAPRHPA